MPHFSYNLRILWCGLTLGGLGLGSTALPAYGQQPVGPANVTTTTRSYVAPPGGFGLIDPRLFRSGNHLITTYTEDIPVPAYALTPSNVTALLRVWPQWTGGPIVFPDGTPYQPGSPISTNAVVPAYDCWAIQPVAPAPTPPDGFNGVLMLPGGRPWLPGAKINPNWPVWAWMCANWKWRIQTTYALGHDP